MYKYCYCKKEVPIMRGHVDHALPVHHDPVHPISP